MLKPDPKDQEQMKSHLISQKMRWLLHEFEIYDKEVKSKDQIFQLRIDSIKYGMNWWIGMSSKIQTPANKTAPLQPLAPANFKCKEGYAAWTNEADGIVFYIKSLEPSSTTYKSTKPQDRNHWPENWSHFKIEGKNETYLRYQNETYKLWSHDPRLRVKHPSWQQNGDHNSVNRKSVHFSSNTVNIPANAHAHTPQHSGRGFVPYHGQYNAHQTQHNKIPRYHTYQGNPNLYPNHIYGQTYFENSGPDKGGPYVTYTQLSTSDLASPLDQVLPCHCESHSCENGGLCRCVHDVGANHINETPV
jgi:hypothetical protein